MAPAGVTGRRISFLRRSAKSWSESRAAVSVLESHGFVVTAHPDAPVAAGSTDIVWMRGSLNWYPRTLASLAAIPVAKRPLIIAWHTEPLPLPAAADLRTPLPNLRELAKILLRDHRATDMRTNSWRIRQLRRVGIPDVLVVSTRSRQTWLAEQRIDSHFVPVGYATQLGRDLGLERDIDAIFIGAMNVRGHTRSTRELRRNGVNLVTEGGWSREKGLWGDRRTEMINRARTFLALQRHPGKLSGVRMLLGMANRSLVIAEPIFDPAPYVPGTHYVSASLADMPDVVRHYLSNEGERAKIADRGHRFVTTELTLEKSIAQILELAGLS